MRPRMRKLIWLIPAGIVGIAVFIAIGGYLVMHLWNWLAPLLFGWRQITFWQALGLLILCRILFGSHGFRPGHRSNFRRRISERWQQRWEQMTPEERDRVRQRFQGRCGPFEPPSATPAP